MGVVINFILHCNHYNRNSVCVRFPESVDAHGCRAKGWFTLCTKFVFKGTSPANYLCTVRSASECIILRPTTLPLTVFTFRQRKLCSRLSSKEVDFCTRIGHFAFLAPFWGLEAAYDVHLRLIGKLVLDFL